MKTERLVQIPVDLLWEYRFTDQYIPYATSGLSGGINMYDVLEITEHIKGFGIDPLELSVVSSMALLTDGNHRIVAARRLGLEDVPVNITVYEAEQIVSPRKLLSFRPICKDLETLLKEAFI